MHFEKTSCAQTYPQDVHHLDGYENRIAYGLPDYLKGRYWRYKRMTGVMNYRIMINQI